MRIAPRGGCGTSGPDGITAFRGDGPAEVTLTGDAYDLYLAVWNRGDDSNVTVTGDRGLLESWHS
ncbi:MAG: maleylpyruvate isomerase family mycothiol-dependent enzyme, partial [Actinobacteria bacterium]